MVMLVNFEFNVGYYGDIYLCNSVTSPRACIRCDSGGLLFYPAALVYTGTI
jgi:hypothetical protein